MALVSKSQKSVVDSPETCRTRLVDHNFATVIVMHNLVSFERKKEPYAHLRNFCRRGLALAQITVSLQANGKVET